MTVYAYGIRRSRWVKAATYCVDDRRTAVEQARLNVHDDYPAPGEGPMHAAVAAGSTCAVAKRKVAALLSKSALKKSRAKVHGLTGKKKP